MLLPLFVCGEKKESNGETFPYSALRYYLQSYWQTQDPGGLDIICSISGMFVTSKKDDSVCGISVDLDPMCIIKQRAFLSEDGV